MRFSVVALVAAVAAVAHAQSAAYPFAPNGPCVKECLLTVGKGMDPNFTDDPTSPYFITSLAFAHERQTPKYMAYMSTTGPCIGKCPLEEQGIYNKDYPAKNDWYVANKNGGGTAPSSSSGATSSGKPSATSAPAPGSTSGSTAPPKPTDGSSASSLAASSFVGAAALLVAVALF
ncbi:hypothetical protein BGX27_007834 [Mortierella sp. AM989]|nr:hypothetical protein BGX27_007834 [Mortierella sp. AM989]